MSAPQAEPQTVYCLAIDLIGSTKQGLKLRSWELDAFNKALIAHIRPHIEALELNHAVVKFTGDGWLVMSPTAASKLCCLALLFRDSFRTETAALSGLSLDKIPAIRAAMCSGRDLEVVAPSGQRDYVGDSARRAVRASGLCMDAEVIVNSAVRDWVSRDFVIGGEDLAKLRTLPAKWEEDMQLFQLQSIHDEVISSTTAPADFVYTLGRIGRRDAAVSAAVAIRERYEILSVPEGAHEEWKPGSLPSPDAVTPSVRHPAISRSPFPALKWNQVLDSLPDYAAAQALVEAMRKKGLPCDVATYAILMKKAPTIAEARVVMHEMVDHGVAPNVVGYSTLLNKAESYAQAADVLEEMKKAGVAPDVVGYNTLLNKAESYAQAAGVLEEMKKAGVAPNVVGYNTLLNKAESYAQAVGVLEEMKKAGVAPDVVGYNTLLNKAESYAQAAGVLEEMKKAGVAPNVVGYNTLLNKAESYAQAAGVLEEMKKAGVAPDVVGYSTLLNKAESYAQAAGVLEEMKKAGVAPNVVGYSTLLNKAESYAQAADVLEEMKKAGVAPNVVGYSTLLNKAESYAQAAGVLEEMKKAGVAPNVVGYNSLFSKSPGNATAREILSWYARQDYHPSDPLNALLAVFRKAQRPDDALEIVLDHPHLSAAKKILLKYPVEAREKFQAARATDPNHPTADFALGALALAQKDFIAARESLQCALQLAPHRKQKETIQKWLIELETEAT